MRRRTQDSLSLGFVVCVLALGMGAATARVEAANEHRYPVQHVIFGRTQLDLFTTGAWPPFVHEGDSFMVTSGNEVGDINCGALNYLGNELLVRYPGIALYAATSGIRNLENGALCVDASVFRGVVLVYEPNRANAPEFSWDHTETAGIFTDVRNTLHLHGLEAWTKISGRAARGRDQFGAWDYGLFGQILDGMIIQTQGSCRDRDSDGNYTHGRSEFNDALESIHEMYSAVRTTTPLFARVTTSSIEANSNAVPPHGAMQCALAAWAMPEAGHVTLRTAIDRESIEAATMFYRVREDLLRGDSRVSAAGIGALLPAPAASDPDAFQPALTATGVSLVSWRGGNVTSLRAALGVGNSLWVFSDGSALGYIAGVPDFVNKPFLDRYGPNLPAGTLGVVALVR